VPKVMKKVEVWELKVCLSADRDGKGSSKGIEKSAQCQ